ncbi:MAG: DUF393 domain-containing protein [Candidatus Sumerlaeaceae bacterium]|nr:DUF393 domain-containing protein [Candidatus Sumerlaeaceae bacterium]
MRGVYLVYFDDACPLCRRFAQRLERLDRCGTTRLVPLSAAASAAAPVPLDMEACQQEIHVVTPAGRVLRGWDAVAALAQLFPATYWIGALGTLPGLQQAGRWAYRQIARRRRRSCRGHPNPCAP